MNKNLISCRCIPIIAQSQLIFLALGTRGDTFQRLTSKQLIPVNQDLKFVQL